MTVVDSDEFALTHILPTLPDHARLSSLALHPTCPSPRLGRHGRRPEVAGAGAATVAILTMRPSRMIATRSQARSTSGR